MIATEDGRTEMMILKLDSADAAHAYRLHSLPPNHRKGDESGKLSRVQRYLGLHANEPGSPPGTLVPGSIHVRRPQDGTHEESPIRLVLVR